VARPSATRHAEREQMRARYHDAHLTELRERAERAYRAFVEAGSRPAG
jgi:hypothetical protein